MDGFRRRIEAFDRSERARFEIPVRQARVMNIKTENDSKTGDRDSGGSNENVFYVAGKLPSPIRLLRRRGVIRTIEQSRECGCHDG